MQFRANKLDFGLGGAPQTPAEQVADAATELATAAPDNGEGLPAPHILRAEVRRMAGIREAKAAPWGTTKRTSTRCWDGSTRGGSGG